MSAQFHTPSFGDELFDLTDVEPVQTIEIANVAKNCDELKRSKADVKEPVKPVSAYALFFRDTVSAIKAQNPNTSFDDISKIVHSMWQVLDPNHKNVYNKKSEQAKKEYIKQMASKTAKSSSMLQDEVFPQNNEQLSFVQQSNISPKPAQIASKPAVFTITRPGPEPPTAVAATNNVVYCNNSIPTVQDSNAMNQQPQITQSPNEALPIQICIRENCNKRAIVNPDWEDEYCSNECVVIHCRNVFNQWVKSNLEGQA